MKKVILALIVINLSIAQQEPEKVSRRIQLVETYTSPDLKLPKKILVYSGGNFELAPNYNNLFNKIQKRTLKEEKTINYVYNTKADFPKNLKSFDELDIKFNNDKYEAICVLLLGNVEMSAPDKVSGEVQMYVNKSPEYFYDFYLLMVEANTHKILMKRKYNVTGTDLFNKDGKELAKVISKVLIK